MKIVVLDGYSANPGDLQWDALQEYGELTVYDRTSPSQLIERAGYADCILTNKMAIRKEEIDALPKLKYIGVLATGYNIIDIMYARERGIIVTNIPAYSTDSVAQLVFAHILTVASHVEHYAGETRNGKWSACKDFCYWDTPLIELAGKTIGIVGLGNIGMKVAQLARAFGMDVYAYTSKNSSDLPHDIHKTTLDGLLSISDILSLHCPLNDSTREMINATALQKIKKGAILVNTGRGPLINEHDVAAALQDGTLKAYCADVLSKEPPLPDNPLLKCENAYITPHIAWATKEARTRLVHTAIANIKAFVENHPQNVISYR